MDKLFPVSRAEAEILAKEMGRAYYASDLSVGWKSIRFVTSNTLPSEEGTVVVGGNTWSKREAESVVRGLNAAYQAGLQASGDHTIRVVAAQAVKPLLEKLEQHIKDCSS